MRALPLHNVIWSVALIGDLFCWRQKVVKPVSEVDEEDLDRSSHLVDVSDGGAVNLSVSASVCPLARQDLNEEGARG